MSKTCLTVGPIPRSPLPQQAIQTSPLQRPLLWQIRESLQIKRDKELLGRRKYLWRVATRYDRCPKAFLSALAFAAIVINWP